jgi:RND family efflux transporter MFP subunit
VPHVLWVFLGLALLSGPACNRSQAQGPQPGHPPSQNAGARAEKGGAPSPAAVRPIPVTTGRAETRPIQRTVETSGSLLAVEEVQAKSEQPGTIARLYVDLGDRVAAGTVLADYDRREFQLTVDQAQADVLGSRELLARARATALASEAQLRRVRDSLPMLEADVNRAQSQHEWAGLELERSKRLNAQDLIAAREVDNARNQEAVAAAQVATARTAAALYPDQVRAAEAQWQSDLAAVKSAEAQVRQREATLSLAQKRLGDTTARAPLSGFIAKRHVSAGEYIKENTPLFTIVVPNPLKYVGTVPERQAPELQNGQRIDLTVEAYPGRAFTGTVTRLAPAVDVATRTLNLEARVPNPELALRPGFFAKGRVHTRQETAAVFVASEALSYVAGLNKMFVITAGRAQERTVRLGTRQGTMLEVVDGIQAGDTVAISNLPALFEGAPVDVLPTR